MDKIRVLLADDEQIIRRGLRTMLATDSSLVVVGEAEDGELALNLCKETHPDIAFVDINMPFIDGLSCIAQLRQVCPATIVIVISGYDDFEYARKAIELGVFSYLLKPVQEASFFATLADAKEALRKAREVEAYVQWTKEQLSKNKEALIAYFLHALLTGSYEEEEILQEIRYLGITIPTSFSLFLIKMNQHAVVLEKPDWQDSLMFFAVKEQALSLFPPGTLWYRHGSSELVLLCDELTFEERRFYVDALQERVGKQIPCEFLAVSTNGEGYLAIAEKFALMEEELSQLGQLPKTLMQAQDYLAMHFHENTISLGEVADHVQVTSQHLSRLFKASLNVTFVEYLRVLRIQKALELFKDSERKIYEVAEEVGYSSQHYFCTAFKRVLHLSPQEYRKTQKQGDS
ncbi:MAG: response regulator transcription factor [Sphaerochaetaceae bacterium]